MSRTKISKAEFLTAEEAENAGFATKGNGWHLCVSLGESESVSVNVGGQRFVFWFMEHDGKMITCDVAVPAGTKRAKVFNRSPESTSEEDYPCRFSSQDVSLEKAKFISLCFD